MTSRFYSKHCFDLEVYREKLTALRSPWMMTPHFFFGSCTKMIMMRVCLRACTSSMKWLTILQCIRDIAKLNKCLLRVRNNNYDISLTILHFSNSDTGPHSLKYLSRLPFG